MGYCEATEVAALTFTKYNENTDPTLGEVNGHIETAEGIINALLSNAGYTKPVETS